jgi:methylated-DNA-[protein]-cysteine S-methyltransferase
MIACRGMYLPILVIFETALGKMGIVGTSSGVRRLILPGQQELFDEWQAKAKRVIQQGQYISPFDDLINRLKLYVSGKFVDFSDRLDLAGASLFQEKVWCSAQKIAYGQTRSYGWMAGEIGCEHGARAVGRALGSNPLPIIIPCHRIISADGSLGGFSAGLALKRQLLQLEGLYQFSAYS